MPRRHAITQSDAATLAAYLREIAKLPRLSVEEERDLGGRMNLSRERVRQIESRAKEKLRCSAKLRSHLN